MDISSSLGKFHLQFQLVPRRSSLSSESHAKLRFSGARLFCWVVLAVLLLTWPWSPPCVGAATFVSNTSASPSADGPLVTLAEALPSPSLAPTSPPLSPPISTNPDPPSPGIGAPQPEPVTRKRKRLNLGAIVGIVVSAVVLGICLSVLLCCWIVSRRPHRIFISSAGGLDSSSKNFTALLHHRMKTSMKAPVNIFHVVSINIFEPFPKTILKESTRFDVGIVIVSQRYFEIEWCMVELMAFMEALENDSRNRIRVLPLFWELSHKELMYHLEAGTWEERWQAMAEGNHPIRVETCRQAVRWLCSLRGLEYMYSRRDHDVEYTESVCRKLDKILQKDRNFASNLLLTVWSETKQLGRVSKLSFIGSVKRRKYANQRAGRENALTTYINTRLQLLFGLSGVLNVLLSVILDNSFNDRPVRFIAFSILVPFTIFWGFLASGWFPRIPLHFIAFVKRRGFLTRVVPCSPWHDNVVTDYCGQICTVEPVEHAEGRRTFELPTTVQRFLFGDPISPRETTTTHLTLDSEIQDFPVATSASVELGIMHDFQGRSARDMLEFAYSGGISERSHVEMATNQISSPVLSKRVPPAIGEIVVDFRRPSSAFQILGDERAPMLEFVGPEINGVPLTVQAFKDASTREPTFDVSCIFRNKRTKRMFLTCERLRNLVQNMCQWVRYPHPIVIDESSDILHCMAIHDILWGLTKGVYTFKPVQVEHRFLAGLWEIKVVIVITYTCSSFVLSLTPLLCDQKSWFFLFFIFFLLPYLFTLTKTNPLNFYFFKSFFTPIWVRIFGFHSLYRSKSPFRWCNEFRKEKIVNPTLLWIDEEYANDFIEADTCFDLFGLVEIPDLPPHTGGHFLIECKGWPVDVVPDKRKKQHNFNVQVKFDAVALIGGVNYYTDVKMTFFDGDCFLGKRVATAGIEVQKLHFIEKLFHCFSNPSFGGYVEEISPHGWCPRTFVAHCPRFIDFCKTIIHSSSIPRLLVVSRMCGSKFTVGVPFWTKEL